MCYAMAPIGQANAAVTEQRAQASYLSSQDFKGARVSGTKYLAARQRAVAVTLADDLTMVS
jgi:hypothetical protein